MKKNYKSTVNACFAGYVVQAIVNNFVPLLFLTFNKSYGIELSKITALITVNFILQLIIDLLSAFFIDKIGYRAAAIMAHVFAAAGLVSLTVLPEILPSPFVGLLISVVLYAVGGGLLEVIVSPIVEACPTDNKEKMMSLLHSFYCWGSVAVVGISTLYFSIFTTANWKYLALIWAVVPIVNALNFIRVPIAPLIEEGETGLSFKQLLGNRMFWIFMLLILCSGASEQAVSQWASTFAEKGLGVSKTVGDLAGPMLFSVLMGVSRVIYGKFGD
ncbi:MAG: MFS transporter [Clostridiales bacterium]